jgi:uncharacterized protein (DUF1778 family)
MWSGRSRVRIPSLTLVGKPCLVADDVAVPILICYHDPALYGKMPYTRVMTKTQQSRVELRLPTAEKELGQTAADLLGESLSEFYRRAARAEAERVLAERQRIVVDLDVAERVLAALDRPGKRNERLARLWEKPSLLGA